MTGRTAEQAVRAATEVLAPSFDTARLDAELLMAHALDVNRSDYLLRARDHMEPENFWPLVERRTRHEPIAYILGAQPFWTIDIKVAPGVLIPRADSETLIEAAILHFTDKVPPRHILDIGSGPGTLLLAALSEWPQAQGVGAERSSVALNLARDNAVALGMGSRSNWLPRDWTQSQWAEGLGGPFDLILCNPPYIETACALEPQVRDHEPHEALFAGEHGLDDYRLILPALPELLTSAGIAILEIGWNQANAVRSLAEQQGFAVTLFQDLGGRDRALLLEKRP